MNCEEVNKSFSECYDEELAKEKKKLFFEHVKSCSECQREWDSFNAMMNKVGDLDLLADKKVPRDLTNRVIKKIHQRSNGRFFNPKHSYPVRFAIISFVLILFFVFAYLYFTAWVDINEIQMSKDKDEKVLKSDDN